MRFRWCRSRGVGRYSGWRAGFGPWGGEKLQTSNSKLQGSINIKISKSRLAYRDDNMMDGVKGGSVRVIGNRIRQWRVLEFGIWSFPEVWSLKFAVLIAGIFLLTGYGRAAVFQEDFTTDPMGHGWSRFGETNLFYWNATNQNLEVTWDSSKSNSYFQIGTWTILGRADDFSFGVDLRLDDIEGGVDPDKPGPMEIAFGFQNYVDAEKTNF